MSEMDLIKVSGDRPSRREIVINKVKESAQNTWGAIGKFIKNPRFGNSNWISTIRLVWRLFWKKGTGVLPRLALLLTAVYIVSPLDFLPAIVFDDITVLLFGVKLFLALTPEKILGEEMRALDMKALP
jgi:uncharacterized membrane protein YkvA (DUF1232 family)